MILLRWITAIFAIFLHPLFDGKFALRPAFIEVNHTEEHFGSMMGNITRSSTHTIAREQESWLHFLAILDGWKDPFCGIPLAALYTTFFFTEQTFQ